MLSKRNHRWKALALLTGLLLVQLGGVLHFVLVDHGIDAEGRLVEHNSEAPGQPATEDLCTVWSGPEDTPAVTSTVVSVALPVMAQERWRSPQPPPAKQRPWAFAPKQSPPQPS